MGSRSVIVSAHETTGAGARATAGTDGDAMTLRPADELGDDQEIAGEAHPDDDVQLVGQAFPVGMCPRLPFVRRHARRRHPEPQARLQAFGRLGAQFVLLAPAGGDRVRRQDGRASLHHEGASPGHDEGIVRRLRQVGEQGAHLLGRLEPVLGP